MASLACRAVMPTSRTKARSCHVQKHPLQQGKDKIENDNLEVIY